VADKSIDLHVHSTFSDGKLTPVELAARAVHNNVCALAITDHDSLAGMEEKQAACDSAGIECICGVEISCELDGREAHVLSLFADPESPHRSRLDSMQTSRERRMEKMIEKLAGIGITMTMEELQVGEDGAYGRPHLARALVAKGICKSVNEAFARFLYDGGPVHIEKSRFSVAEGIVLAKELGGVAVIAHPGISGLIPHLDELFGMGLEGVEVYHPKHGGETIAGLLRYCRERNLLVSGGSDFHAPGDGADIGASKVPVDVLETLRRAALARKAG
jgi:Predicted metal-dependent phosphoesterases (PHP family)